MDLAALGEICARHHVVLLVQFGSTVRGTTHERSDLDLAALVDEDGRPRPSLLDLSVNLAVDLAPLFPERELDLALINHADPLFLQHIAQGGRLLYGTSRRLAELRAYAYRRYQDHKRFLALERNFVRRTLAQGTPR